MDVKGVAEKRRNMDNLRRKRKEEKKRMLFIEIQAFSFPSLFLQPYFAFSLFSHFSFISFAYVHVKLFRGRQHSNRHFLFQVCVISEEISGKSWKLAVSRVALWDCYTSKSKDGNSWICSSFVKFYSLDRN